MICHINSKVEECCFQSRPSQGDPPTAVGAITTNNSPVVLTLGIQKGLKFRWRDYPNKTASPQHSLLKYSISTINP